MTLIKIKASHRARYMAKAVKSHLQKDGESQTRRLLAKYRRRLRSEAPKSKRKQKSHDEQVSKYGTLKRQVGKIRTLRVKSIFKVRGWAFRAHIGRGKAYWMHMLNSGVNGRKYPKNQFFHRAMKDAAREFNGVANNIKKGALKAAERVTKGDKLS